MRIALYAEGTRETGQSGWLSGATSAVRVEAGAVIPTASWGAAHILTARCLRSQGGSEPSFVGPLALHGRRATGSQLLVRRNLRALCSWADPSLAPDACIVLVDADGDRQRRRLLGQHVEGLPQRVVIGVAREAFESWLLADLDAVRRALDTKVDAVRSVESIDAPRAKEILDRIIEGAGVGGMEALTKVRARIAEHADLEVVADAARSFAEYRTELGKL